MSLQHFPPEIGASPPSVVRLPVQCGTAAAPAVHRALVDAVAGGVPPVVDAGEVQTLGQAMLQLLLAARAAAPSLTIDPVSPALRQRLHALKVAATLGVAAQEG